MLSYFLFIPCIAFHEQILTPKALPLVCLLPSPPVTATSQTMVQTSNPNKDDHLLPFTLFWIVHTGKGKLEHEDTIHNLFVK